MIPVGPPLVAMCYEASEMSCTPKPETIQDMEPIIHTTSIWETMAERSYPIRYTSPPCLLVISVLPTPPFIIKLPPYPVSCHDD